jgi:hypothetical protein
VVPGCFKEDLPENFLSFGTGCWWSSMGNLVFNLSNVTLPVGELKVGVSAMGSGGEVNSMERDGYGKMVGVELGMSGPG